MLRPPRLVDTDVHNSLSDSKELLAHLPRLWREMWGGAIRMTSTPYASPIGVSRSDARTPDGKPAGSDPAYLMQHHMDRYGIDYAILTGSGILSVSLHPDPDYGNALASAFNEWMVEKWLEFSPRYYGSIIINHADPPAAVQEIEKWASHPKMKQVIMASGSRNLFGQREYHPIYEAAERHNLPVAVHPGTESNGISGPPTPSGYPTRYMEWHNILPTNYMAHINSLVCEGVFEKFPKLKFVAIEGGVAWLPHLMWRMDKNYKALRASTPWLKKLPSEYIKEHVLLTTQPIEEPENPKHLTQIFEMIGADKILMFSSDYAHWDFDNPKMTLPPMSREMKARIFAGNATELYNLPDVEDSESAKTSSTKSEAASA